VSIETPKSADAWRLAALAMMPRDRLQSIFGGDACEAAPWVISAARCGLADAQIRLGRMLLAGEGLAKDEIAALSWFHRAADKDDPEAQNMVGRCHENGWGTAPDASEAAIWYERAASAGHTWAQYNLGHLLLDGNGVECDRSAAFQLYLSAAKQGHARAMNLVARCREEGWGIEVDCAAARHWYRRSAEAGYFRGAYNYASVLAAEGCIEGAACWFTRALAQAPQPTRNNICDALSRHPNRRLRALASSRGEKIARASGDLCLEDEQSFFERQASTIAGQAAIGADHAVAGNDEPDGVAAIGKPQGARRAGTA